jgi:hypothetical protein
VAWNRLDQEIGIARRLGAACVNGRYHTQWNALPSSVQRQCATTIANICIWGITSHYP